MACRKTDPVISRDAPPSGLPVIHIFNVISDFVRKKNVTAGFGQKFFFCKKNYPLFL